MSSDAEILPPRAGDRTGVFGLAFLLMLDLPARRGHNPRPVSV